MVPPLEPGAKSHYQWINFRGAGQGVFGQLVLENSAGKSHMDFDVAPGTIEVSAEFQVQLNPPRSLAACSACRRRSENQRRWRRWEGTMLQRLSLGDFDPRSVVGSGNRIVEKGLPIVGTDKGDIQLPDPAGRSKLLPKLGQLPRIQQNVWMRAVLHQPVDTLV
jgi:hypothetical protein